MMNAEVRISKPAKVGCYAGYSGGRSTQLADALVEFIVGDELQTLQVPCTIWARLSRDRDTGEESTTIEAGLPKGLKFEDDNHRDEFKELVLSTAMVDFQYPNMELKALERLKGQASKSTATRTLLTADQIAERLAGSKKAPTAQPAESAE